MIEYRVAIEATIYKLDKDEEVVKTELIHHFGLEYEGLECEQYGRIGIIKESLRQHLVAIDKEGPKSSV